jgi:hypothetical protein
MTARAARLAMVELTAARAEVEAAMAADVARVATVDLMALRGSSNSSSVTIDGGTNDELKLAREAAREQAMQWVATHPLGRSGGSPDGCERAAVMALTAAVAQTIVDAPTAGSIEIMSFTGDAALPPRIGNMVTGDPDHCQGCRSRRCMAYPHQDQLCRVGRGDEDTAPGVAHVESSLVRRCQLLRGSTGAGCPHCYRPA